MKVCFTLENLNKGKIDINTYPYEFIETNESNLRIYRCKVTQKLFKVRNGVWDYATIKIV